MYRYLACGIGFHLAGACDCQFPPCWTLVSIGIYLFVYSTPEQILIMLK